MPLIIRGLKEDVNISLRQLEGGDLTIQPASNLIHHFNPHHREGGDEYDIGKAFQAIISIHTTAKVVTNRGSNPNCPHIFQSTPPRRW